MRADRLLSIIWLLRAHGGLPTAELARRLDVSRRTILRDVEALSAAGVPVYCERGPHGGVRLLPGYRTDVTALSNEESRALFAGVTTWGADSLGLGDALASALRKLLAAVPDPHRGASSEMRSRLVIDPQGWLPQTERERAGQTLHTIQEAVFTQHRLLIEHRAKARDSLRSDVVEPHGVISAGRSWYLCASRGDELLFLKVSRIETAQALPEQCSGTEIDVAAAWRRRRDEFIGGFTAVVAHAWVRDTRWSDVHEWAIRVREHPRPAKGGDRADATTATAASQQADRAPAPGGPGWSLLELEFVDRLHAMTVLLRLGPDARLAGPADLQSELTAYLAATLAHYVPPLPGRPPGP